MEHIHPFIDLSIQEILPENQELASTLKSFLVQHYEQTGRYYHNSNHIEHMLALTYQYCAHLNHIRPFLWAVLFHDVVYSVSDKDNELNSAKTAERWMTKAAYNELNIQHTFALIMCTQTHKAEPDTDEAWMIDFDLAKLGAAPKEYADYARAIRLEYQVFPDSIYTPGRVKVLQHFLSQEFIFNTATFQHQYEKQARVNLENELHTLTN